MYELKELSDHEIKEYFLEEAFLEFTIKPKEAIFLLRDGTLISGFNTEGNYRYEDHNCVDAIFYEVIKPEKFWSTIHKNTSVVVMVPETKKALIMENQKLSKQQMLAINNVGYKIEAYCKDIVKAKEQIKNNEYEMQR
jgi:hypothetical protein